MRRETTSAAMNSGSSTDAQVLRRFRITFGDVILDRHRMDTRPVDLSVDRHQPRNKPLLLDAELCQPVILDALGSHRPFDGSGQLVLHCGPWRLGH